MTVRRGPRKPPAPSSTLSLLHLDDADVYGHLTEGLQDEVANRRPGDVFLAARQTFVRPERGLAVLPGGTAQAESAV